MTGWLMSLGVETDVIQLRKTLMTFAEAVQVLVDMASRWGENAEEAFPRRIEAEDNEAECARLADGDEDLLQDIGEVRDLWRAIEIVRGHMNKAVEAAPR
jgi:hypothetical protein